MKPMSLQKFVKLLTAEVQGGYAYLGNPPQLSAEEEADLPEEFQNVEEIE